MPCLGPSTAPPDSIPGVPVGPPGGGPGPLPLPPPAGDTTPPASPAGLFGTGLVAGNQLMWSLNLETDLAGYNVYSSLSQSGTFVKLNTGLLTSAAYIDTAAVVASPTWYHVTAVDTSGNESQPSAVSVTRPAMQVLPPAAPTGVVATPTLNSIQLAWNANGEPDLAGYNVKRATSGAGPFTQINASLLTFTGYNDLAVTAGVHYYYEVLAHNTSGLDSSPSAIVNAVAGDTTPPAVPTNVVGHDGVSNVSVTWDANTEPDLAGYNVYRSTAANGNFVLTPGSPVLTNAFTDGTINAGDTLYYTVTAFDTSNNESAMSQVVSATRQAGAPGNLPIIYDMGQAPALAVVSLWGQSVPGGYTQRQCRYTWDAGDPGSAYNHVVCSSPMFHHFYVNPGTYTINCTREDPNGNITTYHATVPVVASTRTQYFIDALAGSDTNNGHTSGAAFKTMDHAATLIANNTEFLFKRGQTHVSARATTPTTVFPVSNSNVVFRDYGDPTQAKPVLFIQYPKASGTTNSSDGQGLFGASPTTTRAVRWLNLKFDSSTASANFGNQFPTHFGSFCGQGLAVVNCDWGRVNEVVNSNSKPDYWLLQGINQLNPVGSEAIWGEGTYAAFLGVKTIGSTKEIGVRCADTGMVNFWVFDCDFGDVLRTKAAVDWRTVHNFCIGNSRCTGSEFSCNPFNNLREARNGVFENLLLSDAHGPLMHFGKAIYDVDIKNVIFNQTYGSDCMNMDTNQGAPLIDASAPGGVDHYYGMLVQNIHITHCTFQMALGVCKALQIFIGGLRDSTDTIIGKNYPSGMVMKNCLATGAISSHGTATAGRGGGFYSADNLAGSLQGFTSFAGNAWPIIDYDPTKHPASLATDTTHYMASGIANSTFDKLAAVVDEKYQHLTLDANFRVNNASPPTCAVDPVCRYDYDGVKRPVTNGRVTCGARS